MTEKKRALVTGGSRGIGKSITAKMLAAGYDVVIAARSRGEIDETIADFKAQGNVEGRILDLASREAIFAFAKEWKGPLHALVNNAGICIVERIDQRADTWIEDTKSFDHVMDVNLAGPYFLTKSLLPHMPDQSRIVNISSQLGVEARASYGVYCASKFGLIGLTKVWAKELGSRGITVNCVCPGWVRTDQAEGDMQRIAREKGIPRDEYYRQVCAPLELKRFTEPDEVANLVTFLCSPEASGITGRDWLMNTIWNQE